MLTGMNVTVVTSILNLDSVCLKVAVTSSVLEIYTNFVGEILQIQYTTLVVLDQVKLNKQNLTLLFIVFT